MAAKMERKKILFGVLNVAQGLAVGAIPFAVPSRTETVNVVLMALGGVMLVSGPLLVFAGRIGRGVAIAACLLHWLAGLLGAALVFASASYLYGIYGRHGSSAGLIALLVAFMLLVVFWLVPGHELVYLRKKGAAG